MMLTGFVLARIAEKEAGAPSEHYQPFEREWEWCAALDGGDCECNNPRRRARVLAECKAMQRIVEAHERQCADDDESAWIVASEVLLRALASIWSDHEDFDPGWAL